MYRGAFNCAGYSFEPGKDRLGAMRQAIVFMGTGTERHRTANMTLPDYLEAARPEWVAILVALALFASWVLLFRSLFPGLRWRDSGRDAERLLADARSAVESMREAVVLSAHRWRLVARVLVLKVLWALVMCFIGFALFGTALQLLLLARPWILLTDLALTCAVVLCLGIATAIVKLGKLRKLSAPVFLIANDKRLVRLRDRIRSLSQRKSCDEILEKFGSGSV